MLPNEGVSVYEYVESLTGEKISELFANKQSILIETSIPKFETEFDVKMSSVLKEMGIVDAFDEENADFGKIGTYKFSENLNGNIYIRDVIHKTFISVNETGTKAGAATLVDMACATGSIIIDAKRVYLNRPFVYMLIDCENNIPFFIGTMMDVNQ